jgi:hypothetical protein
MFATERIAQPGGKHSYPYPQRIDHYAVPDSGLQYLEATATHLVLANRSVKLVAADLSPTRPLIESNLSEWLSGGFEVLLAGDLNAKHTDWKSRLTTARGSRLRGYAIRNTCLIYGSDCPTTAPNTQRCPRRPRHSGCQGLPLTGVSDCLLCTQLGSPTYPSQHHVPIIFSRPTGPPRLHANVLGCIPGLLDDRLPGNPVVNDEEAIDK